ncbi:MAG: hypothetical protein IJI68_04460, partial [Eggerthellaceae bacterium]|nr:hypothetical protein [Eggerthellaceae bacterium]
LFTVVVIGGLGSLPGALLASLLVGLVQTFAVVMDVSLDDVFRNAVEDRRADAKPISYQLSIHFEWRDGTE